MKKLILGLFMFLTLVSILLATQICPQPTIHNTYSEIYEVINIYSPCCEDIVFKLHDDNYINYINRGLEKGVNVSEWNGHYKNKALTFTFVKHKSLFGPKHRTIAKIELENKTIYNAFI